MIRDPFYKEIFKRLAEPLDCDLFELCANALLRKDFPTLVPIRGGTDSGMDGATAAPGPFLVCTTSEDVIGNLTKNLNSYLRSGESRRSVLLATSQELTKRKRANLEKRARELGFYLKHIYGRAALAERLYYEPRWCRELLGLTGRPSALTVFPRTERPLLDHALIGRDSDLKWLRESKGDRLLVGQPGCGKTFLLRSLALEGWGLFLVDSDIEALAAAIRSQQPKIIIVDDAHFRLEILSTLRQLRAELMVDFEIVATSWEGDQPQGAEALALPSSQIHQLELLTRDEIVEVIKQTDLAGPVELIRELVDQAEGRPGLAVTLSYLCLNGDAREVFLGEALYRSIGTTFQSLVGQEANTILGAFALSGDAGMPMEKVASFLQLSLAQLRGFLIRLAAGGVLRENRQGNISVWPRTLRYVLVRDTFFSAKYNLQSTGLMQEVLDKKGMVETLIGAISRGAKVPDIIELLESLGSAYLWRDYASLGEEEAKFVINHCPKLLHTFGQVTLQLAPRETLPLLLKASIGDGRELHNTPEHPLRWIEDWIQEAEPGRGQAVARRQLLIDALKRWSGEGGDEQIIWRALPLAVVPTFHSNSTDPGSGFRVTLYSGLLTISEISELKGIWRQAKEIAMSLSTVEWSKLSGMAHKWVYPEVGSRIEEIPSELRREIRSLAVQIIEDLSVISRVHPGAQQQLKRYAERLGLEIEFSLDDEFEILFAEIDRADAMGSLRRQTQQVLALSERWITLMPAEAASRLLFLENEAARAGKNWPRGTVYLCEQIAKETTEPSIWLDEFITKGLPADTGEPFLRKAMATRAPGWERVIAACLDNPHYAWIAVSVVLTLQNVPDELLHRIIEKAGDYPGLIETLCLRDQVPESTLLLLLLSPERAVSTSSAIGAWMADPQGQIRETIAADWRTAILHAEGEEFWLCEILKRDQALAFEWLTARIEAKTSLIPFHIWQEVEAAISVLDLEQRIAVLQLLDNSESLNSILIAKLAGDDLTMYQEILKHERFSKLHLAPLTGHPTERWAEKAILALEAGYSSEQIVSATIGYGDSSWVGNISQMWRRWTEDFEAFTSHVDERVRRIAELGATETHERERTEAASEHREAVYGR